MESVLCHAAATDDRSGLTENVAAVVDEVVLSLRFLSSILGPTDRHPALRNTVNDGLSKSPNNILLH